MLLIQGYIEKNPKPNITQWFHWLYMKSLNSVQILQNLMTQHKKYSTVKFGSTIPPITKTPSN